jgi:hypothetical protein
VIVSTDGLREVAGRGDLRSLASDGLVVADAGLAPSLPATLAAGQRWALPLRERLSPKEAAVGGVIAWLARTGVLEKAAVRAATEALGGDAPGLGRAVETAWALAT